MSYTLGPWHVDHTDRGQLQIWSDKGTLIANMAGQSGLRQANASLIAAAPEMLSALEQFVALDDGDDPSLWKVAPHLERMRAVIKKAKQERSTSPQEGK